MLNVTMLSLSVIMLNVIMLNVIMLCVVMLSVAALQKECQLQEIKFCNIRPSLSLPIVKKGNRALQINNIMQKMVPSHLRTTTKARTIKQLLFHYHYI